MPQKRHSGANQRIGELLSTANANPVAIHLRPAAARGDKLFPPHRVVDHGVLDLTAMQTGNTDRVVGDAPQKVAGAV